MPLFSLYLHVPFCVSKCGYCAFYSEAQGGASSSIEAWLDALSREASRIDAIWEGRPRLRTLYIGGGTPTVLSLFEWKRLLRILNDGFDFSEIEEVTVEANPCSLTDGHLSLWSDSFVTRVSLGVQSLRDDELSWLGRRHDARAAARALEKTCSRGFDVSADLIFGLPFQTLRTWRDSLRRVLDSGVGHVSVYQLTLEPGTPLGDAEPLLPDGYLFYRFAQWYLPRKKLEQYEIASFSRPGKECRHNLAYWRQEPVLALGPSAWGYFPENGFRYRNAPTLEGYIPLTETQPPVTEAEQIGEQGLSRGIEAAILALRTKWGIDTASFAARFGEELTEKVLRVLRKIPPRLVRFFEGGVCLTPSGMRIGNAIWVELLELADERDVKLSCD
ncbi:MAG: radical SAM family heme chaperone HemW [Synergistaceae bacterium]|jgi:oxygen-independent coproporphyrinogen-3 oxidase|nr:radical SAM family heme chaperone HemW [Synergistaceae bacterium]